MSESQILERLTPIFRDVLDEPDLELALEMTADDVEAWDSITHIQLMVEIEQAFGTRLSTGQVARLRNVGDLVAALDAT